MRLSRICIFIAFLFVSQASVAQYKTVIYDAEKNFFNEGQALPFESNIMLSGTVPARAALIEFLIFKNGASGQDPLFIASWKKTRADQTGFHMPINYKLRQNSSYDFEVRYYQSVTATEKAALYQTIGSSLATYLDQSVSIKGSDIEFSKGQAKIYDDLNSLVEQGLQFYQNDLEYAFPGFSQIVEDKLKELGKTNLKDNKFYQLSAAEDTTQTKRTERFKFFQTKLDDMKRLISAELVSYVNTISYIVVEKKRIMDYSTEKGQYVLPVNIGYGATYNSGSFDKISYGAAPYVGFSFPLANKALKNNVLSNSSISFGAYLSNFDNEFGEEVTGPFIGRPLFIGAGTRAFKLIRINAGVAALQKDASDGNLFAVEKIYLRPSVNINFELGLWIGQLK